MRPATLHAMKTVIAAACHAKTALRLLAASLMALTAHARDPAPLDAAVAARVDGVVMAEMERQELVGAAIGVLREDGIVYLKGYGLADREKKEPVTVETVFNWASNSKPLLGVAAMQLVERGKLDLDADVRVLVPEFPDKKEVITMRQLLCHQSGIPHYGPVIPTRRGYREPMPFLDPVNSLDKFNKTPLSHPPGTRVLYSSYACILASAVMQRAGGESCHQQIMSRIARPLGMTSLQLDMERDRQPHWAAGYMKDKSGRVVPAPESAEYWKHGAGGYKSNIRDFALWARAMLRQSLLGARAEAEMLTPQKLRDGTDTDRGLGWMVDQDGARVHHGGKQNEATSRLVLYPKRDHGMVVLTNCGHGDPGAITTAVYKALNER